MTVIYDSTEKPLREQYKEHGFKFRTFVDAEIAEKSLSYIDYLNVNGFLSDKEKQTAQTRLIKFVKAHISPIEG